MHKLLERQLRKHFGSLEAVPQSLRAALDDIDAAYQANDNDRALVERSLELTSQELMARNTALRESEARYRRMVETATEGIWLVGPHDEITFANERLAEMLGYRVQELLGRNMFDFLSTELPPEATDQAGTWPPASHDYRLRRKDGATAWAIASTTPIWDQHGEYLGGLGMFTDITARKRVEEELVNAFERLKELDQFRVQFINNAAHELGTPLTPIKLQVHLLRKTLWERLDPGQRKALEILDRNVERLTQLVSDILDVGKIQAGRLNLRLEAAPLGPILKEAADSFQEAALAKHITLEMSAAPGLQCLVDRRRLGQVLYNLLGNALKFTPAGGKVTLAARRINSDAQIAVRDTGRGLHAGDIPKLFRPFSQVHDTMQVTAPGTGLGLFISRGLLEEMSGRIWCESAGPGKGANFIVELPLVHEAAESTAPQSPEPVPA